jgi:hypothetical protein
MAPFGARLSAARDGLTLDPSWQSTTPDEHRLNGQSWWFQYLPPRYNKGRMTTPPGVTLSVALPGAFGGSVLVCPEDGWDRAVKAIGLSREFQTDVPDVDAAFMLSGSVSDDLAGFFRLPATHRALRALFDQGFDRVEFYGDRVSATCRPWPLDLPDPEPPETFTKVVTALLQLSSGLSMLTGPSASSGSTFHHVVSSPKPAQWVMTGVVGSMLVLCGLLVTNVLSGGELLSRLGGPTLGAGIGALGTLAVVCRAYAFRGRTLVAFLFAISSIVMSATLTTLGILNEQLDRSPAIEHAEVVTTKWMNSGRHTSYHIAVPSWRPDHSREDFTLSRSAWTDARIGASRYVVHSRSGYFGVEWLQDERLYR